MEWSPPCYIVIINTSNVVLSVCTITHRSLNHLKNSSLMELDAPSLYVLLLSVMYMGEGRRVASLSGDTLSLGEVWGCLGEENSGYVASMSVVSS